MDPMFSLPEIVLSDREEPASTQSGSLNFSNFSSHYHQLVPAPQEEPDIHRLSEPSFQTSRVGQFCPLEPYLVTGESVLLRTPTVTDMLQRRANPNHRADTLYWTQRDSNQQCVQHLIPSLAGPVQPQAQGCPSSFNVLPGVCPQTLPPDARFQPGFPPLLPEVIVTPGCSSYFVVPISSPPECCCSTYSPPQSWLLLPEVRPSWCLCPQAVPVHQPCSPDQVSRRTAQQVSRWAMSGTERTEEQNKPEEEEQNNNPPNYYRLQANNTDDNRTKSMVPPGSLPSSEEESLAEVDLEKYIAVVDSLKIQEDWSVEAKNTDNEKKLKIENGSFLEYLDELCSDETFVREIGSTLNAEYLDFLLSSDPELIDLLPLKKQEQEVGSTLNTENLNPPLSSDPDSIDLVLREILEVFQQKISHQSPADSRSVTPVTEETSPGTSRVEETAPLPNAQSPILDPPCSQSDTNPNHDGHNPPLSNKGPQEGRSSCSPLLPSLLLEEPLPTDATLRYNDPVNATSPLNLNGSLTSPQQVLANISPGPSLTSDLEARDNDALVEVPAATGGESEEALTFLSRDTQSAQATQTLQEGPLAVDPPPASESPSTSGVSGSEDPCTIVITDRGPSFRADLLTVSPPQPAGPPAPTVLTLKTLPCPLPQIRIPEGKCSPKNIYPMSSCLAAIAVPATLPFLADSYTNSSTVDISDSVPEKQTVEPPKELQLSEDLASSELGETAGTQKQTASGEEGTTKTFERKKENKTKPKETTNIRRSQRLSGKIEKARLSGEFTIEKAEEKKPCEKSVKKTAKFTPERSGLVYEKQKRLSSGGRQLFKKEESHFEEWSQATKTADTAEQFSEIGEKEQHQRLTGGMQKPEVEGGEQRKANNPNVSTETGAENPPLTKMPQEEKELGEKRKEEGIQMTSFVKRRTWSMATEEKVQLRGEIKHSAMERSEMKSSPKREMQDDDKLEGNVKEDATGQEILPVPSPTKRSRNRRDKGESREPANKTNKEDKLSIPESSLQSPKVQTDTHSTKDSIYSLRSQIVSKRPVHNRLGIQENKADKATQQPCNPKPTAGVKGESVNTEEAERPSLTLSPTKRYRHECGAAERERETKVNETDKAETETEMIRLSPLKGRWQRRAEANADRDQKQKLTAEEKGKEGPRDKRWDRKHLAYPQQ